VGTLIGRGQLFQDISDYHELDRMKNSLIATVSHELRTPLAAIKGYATTLLAEDVRWSAEAQREFLQVISQESDRLSNLVTNLLDLSRIEAGSLQIDREACDLAELIDGVRQALDPELRQRVSVEITADMPPVALDRHRVEAVIRNLVHNADRYGDDAGPIRIAAGRQNGEAVVSVEDDGPGIPPDVGDRIFEPFFRIEDGLARSVPGAGLGLSISRGFIEAHGGRIWLEPEAPPTRIAFSLPLEVLE
jgi:signal transduction histidine kinase